MKFMAAFSSKPQFVKNLHFLSRSFLKRDIMAVSNGVIEKQLLIRDDLASYEKASNLDFNNKIKELQRNGHKIYHFGFGESPFPVPDTLRKALQNHAHVHEYLPVQGLLELRKKILTLHETDTALRHFAADRVLVASGSKELIYLIMNVFRGPVLLTSPSWTTYKPQTRLAGRTAYEVPSYVQDKYLVRPEILEKVVTDNCNTDEYKLLILNSPSNPSGQIYTRDQLLQLSDVCSKHKILVVSDEIYSRLTFPGYQFESLAAVYPEGTIVTNGFSKWASLGGWRIGYALFPDSLCNLYDAVASGASHTYTCAPAPVQYALVDALDDDTNLRQYAVDCATVLHSVAKYAHRRFSEVGVTAPMPQAGYYFMPDFGVLKHRFANGQQLCDAMLQEVDVALMPCDPHYLRPQGEFTTRFCYVNFDGESALRALEAARGENRTVNLEDPVVLRTYAEQTLQGIDVLADWVKKNTQNSNCFFG